MAMISEIKLPDGRIYQPGDWSTSNPLWSTVDVGAGAFPILSAFSYSTGGVVPGSVGPRMAKKTDTNLQGEGAKLPEQEDILIYAIGIDVYKRGPALDALDFPDADPPAVPLADMLRLQRDLIGQLNIAGVKLYTDSTIAYWPAGMGVYSSYSGGRSRVSAGVATGELIGNNGDPSVMGRRVLASPFYIAGGESMTYDIIPGPGEVQGLNLAEDSRYSLCIYFDGPHRRPVA
jgi:hypothetical protein